MQSTPGPAALARSSESEEVVGASRSSTIRLLLDGSDTQHAMGVIRTELGLSAPGAGPHLHHGFSELLYVASGALEVLSGDEVLTLKAGDAAVVPPDTLHAFGAPRSSGADVLIVIAPGIDRFDYFRQMAVTTVLPPPVEFQEHFDNHFRQSEAWARRSSWEPGD